MNESKLIEYLLTTPPSCLQNFNAKPSQLPQPFDDNPCSVWQVVCTCGSSEGRFLGYPLKDYVPDYDGPECFLSPLAFECKSCQTVTELLDTACHGYHAEVARLDGLIDSVKIRGDGPRTAYSCPTCHTALFEVIVGFVFWNPDELIEFDGQREDLYNVFLCYCKCSGCGQTSQPTDFGKL